VPALKHVHTYQLYKAKSGKRIAEKTFRCGDPECTHFADSETVIGKISKCNLCGDEFILDYDAARRVKPRCLKCSETKKGKAVVAARSILANLLVEEIKLPDLDQDD
jgi:hypothetical protein